MSDRAAIINAEGDPVFESGRPFKSVPKTGEQVLTDQLGRMNRALPFSDEAEKGVISGILHDPSERLTRCGAMLAPEAFHHAANRTVYEMLLAFQARGTPLDIATLTHALRDAGQLEKVGGAGSISELYTFLPVAAHWDFYLKLVLDKWLLRLMMAVCAQGVQDGFDHGKEFIDEDVETLLTTVWNRMFEVMQRAQGLKEGASGPKPFKEAVWEAIDQLEKNIEAIAAGVEVNGARLGIASLDRILGGLQPGARVLIGAHSSVGKTSLLMHVARSLVIDQGLPGLIFSQDGLKVTLARRALSAISEVPITDIHSGQGFFHEEGRKKHDKISSATRVACNMELWVQDDVTLTFPQMLAEARRLILQHNIKWIAWDFFQCLTMGGNYKDEVKELKAISGAWKKFLMDTKCIGIMLCQLNWEDTKHGRLSQKNIKDCKAVFDDAEITLLLSKEERQMADLLRDETASGKIGEKDAQRVPELRLGEHIIRVEVAKNKDGRTDPVWVRHYGALMTWHTLTLSTKVRDSSYNAEGREEAKRREEQFRATLPTSKPNYADPNYKGPRGRPRKGDGLEPLAQMFPDND